MGSGDILEALHDAEIDLFRAMNLAGDSELLDLIMLSFTLLGVSYVIVLICIPFWLRGKKEASFDVVVLVILATVLAELIKLIVDRQRPSLELSDVNTILSATGPSFPSGHATRAFAVALFVCVTESRRIGAVAVVVASLISISRVFLGVHWPSDVLAGAILGTLIAFTLIQCVKRCNAYVEVRRRVISLMGGRPI